MQLALDVFIFKLEAQKCFSQYTDCSAVLFFGGPPLPEDTAVLDVPEGAVITYHPLHQKHC